jgi:hypothetical protein
MKIVTHTFSSNQFCERKTKRIHKQQVKIIGNTSARNQLGSQLGLSRVSVGSQLGLSGVSVGSQSGLSRVSFASKFGVSQV